MLAQIRSSLRFVPLEFVGLTIRHCRSGCNALFLWLAIDAQNRGGIKTRLDPLSLALLTQCSTGDDALRASHLHGPAADAHGGLADRFAERRMRVAGARDVF